MTLHRIKPKNTGGGRKRSLISARLAADGQFSMSHAVADMLGTPARVLVDVDPAQRLIILTPTTPGDLGGFALSGGGNASYRIRIKDVLTRWPDANLVAEYQPQKRINAVAFKVKDSPE